MSDRERTEDGTFQETVTLDAVRDVFDAVRGPVVTSSDVSDELDCTTEAARQKLARLYDRGEVDRRKTGRTVVYWRTDTDAESGQERAVTPSEPTDPPSDPAPVADDSTAADGENVTATVEDAVDAVAEGWDDTPDRLAARKNAARAVLQHAVNTGDAIGKSDALEDFQEEFAVEGQNAETWWRKNIRPVLSEYGEYSNGAHGYVVDDLEGEV